VGTEVTADRDAALRWAARMRDARADLRRSMQTGERSLDEVLTGAAADPLISPVRLLFVLESLPGARKVDTRRHLERSGIDGDAAVGSLDDATRARVASDFPLPAPERGR
jgi:hypothetical protein